MIAQLFEKVLDRDLPKTRFAYVAIFSFSNLEVLFIEPLHCCCILCV
jgi:hypothetical protein